MVYAYRCAKCDHEFDVIKSHKDMERNENCTKCGEFATREFVPRKVGFIGASVTNAEYNPGLGCVVRDKRHKEELCRQKGLVEVGNDFKAPSKMVDHYDKAREEKMAKRWEEADV